jgi:pimeloyl-ACP methyl ester carboxylesterase
MIMSERRHHDGFRKRKDGQSMSGGLSRLHRTRRCAERRREDDPVETPKGTFNVWTKRIGNNPSMKVLLLHGGPGMTHEYLEAFDSYFPGAGIEYYYYDQLGSYYSDQPDEPELWEIDRFVEEVEQVRQARGLDQDNFILFGQSWGGILAMEYAFKYQQHLKGLVISNTSQLQIQLSSYGEHCSQGTEFSRSVSGEKTGDRSAKQRTLSPFRTC